MKMTSLVKVHHDLTRPKNPEKSSWAFEKFPKVFREIKVGEMIKHHHLARWLLDCSSSCPIAVRSRCLTLNVFWPSEPPSRPWHRSWCGGGDWKMAVYGITRNVRRDGPVTFKSAMYLEDSISIPNTQVMVLRGSGYLVTDYIYVGL